MALFFHALLERGSGRRDGFRRALHLVVARGHGVEGRGASGTRGGGVDVTESLAERSVGCVVRRRRRNRENRQCGGRPVSWRDLCLAVRATSEGDSECERKRKRGEPSNTRALESLRRGIQRSISLHTIHEQKVLTCEGGSKEDRDEDPLRRAKVYIQCTRMHMEERVCGVRD